MFVVLLFGQGPRPRPNSKKKTTPPLPSVFFCCLGGWLCVLCFFVVGCLGGWRVFLLFGRMGREGGGGGGGVFFFCCLGGWRVLFFAVWAGGVFFFCCLGGGREFTHLPDCLACL